MSEAATTPSQLRGDPDRDYAMHAATDRTHNLVSTTRTERGYMVAVLSGGLDGTRATALREQLLRVLRPGASRLVLDLSLVSHVDACGLAVLVGTERRARLLGGFLRLAAVKPTVFMAVRAAGLDRLLEIFPTVQSAGQQPGTCLTEEQASGASVPASPTAMLGRCAYPDTKASSRDSPGRPVPNGASPSAHHSAGKNDTGRAERGSTQLRRPPGAFSAQLVPRSPREAAGDAQPLPWTAGMRGHSSKPRLR